YPSKNLGAYGEAGALVTSDPAIAAKARMLRNHAQLERYRHECIGYNYRMEALQAAVLSVKLPYLDEWNAARRHHARHYQEQLASARGIVLPPTRDDCESAYHLFVIELANRDRMAEQLAAAGIESGLHYPIPVHLQPAYRHLGFPTGS